MEDLDQLELSLLDGTRIKRGGNVTDLPISALPALSTLQFWSLFIFPYVLETCPHYSAHARIAAPVVRGIQP